MKRLLCLVMVLFIIAGVVIALQPAHVVQANTCLETPNTNGCRSGLPILQYQQLLDEMVLHQEPDVRPLPTNETELLRFAFRRLTNSAGTTFYDGPNGNPIGTIDAGFTYVTVGHQQDGWIEINTGQWVPETDTTVARPSSFSGVLVNPEARYTMAWVLQPVRPSTAPGIAENPDEERLERYTRVNIFATANIDGWDWFLIGPDRWVKQVYVGRVLYIEKPEGIKGRWFAVDLYEQVLVAYENETPVFATLISSGLPEWSTNEGTYQTWARVRNGSMSGAEGQTDFYSLENVPWTLYFDGSISLHGTYWHDGFGYRHSHGCVNMSITDSYWAFQWSADGGYDKPMVYVWASGDYN
ncbi:MAG: L,D-transpeptidase [Chloroflexi bacterium]|nr:L,D-transpeptidase [Chloroflexota bacterium]